MVLEAIRYGRGSLLLLEQRLLPLQTEWVDIQSVEDGWNAIRDMTVRGAPAIADAAALSLAVDLVRGGSGTQFASAQAAVAEINKKLDYLATRYDACITDVTYYTSQTHSLASIPPVAPPQ